MENTILSTEQGKMLAWLALLSKYDLFRISTNDGKRFNATEIVCDEFGNLIFKRLFSSPIYSDAQITDIGVIKSAEFYCATSKTIYTIVALSIKDDYNECVTFHRHTWKSIFDFMDIRYFGNRLNQYIKELNLVILPVDPRKLGKLSNLEHRQIQNIIEITLDGISKSMQMSRTICFQVKIENGNEQICAGIYDLERNNSITSKLIYDGKIDKYRINPLYDKARAIRKYAVDQYDIFFPENYHKLCV